MHGRAAGRRKGRQQQSISLHKLVQLEMRTCQASAVHQIHGCQPHVRASAMLLAAQIDCLQLRETVEAPTLELQPFLAPAARSCHVLVQYSPRTLLASLCLVPRQAVQSYPALVPHWPHVQLASLSSFPCVSLGWPWSLQTPLPTVPALAEQQAQP